MELGRITGTGRNEGKVWVDDCIGKTVAYGIGTAVIRGQLDPVLSTYGWMWNNNLLYGIPGIPEIMNETGRSCKCSGRITFA